MLKQAAKNLVLDTLVKLAGDPDGLVRLAVLRGPARGLRFSFDLSRRIEAAYVTGRYETDQVRRIAEMVRSGMVVWDIGVYLGFYTALFARLVGAHGKVVGFEPDPTNLERARANIRLNGFQNVTFVEAAIGEPVGEAVLIKTRNTNSHIHGAFVGNNAEEYRERTLLEHEEITVRCLSLDQAYADPGIPKPDVVKIDIEGAEEFALQHLHLLAADVGPTIILELHNPRCDAAAWEFARREGYRLISISTGQPLTSPQEVQGTLLCLPE
jgi:FkbM family methyltransferase